MPRLEPCRKAECPRREALDENKRESLRKMSFSHRHHDAKVRYSMRLSI